MGISWKGSEMTSKVHYERVNLADIDTSSDEDDYGDLFAAERGRIVKGRPKVSGRKKGKTCGGGCIKGLCVLFSVLLVLMVLAGIALYIDPGDDTKIVGDEHDDMAKNVTSVDNAGSVSGLVDVKNSTEVTMTDTSDIEVNNSNLTVTSEKPYSEVVEATQVVEATKVDEANKSADKNNVESWSSSMAGGAPSRSTRSRNSSSSSSDATVDYSE